MSPLQKQMLDDVFDAFTMLCGGNIISLMHVQGGVTRWSPGAVELLGLPGEYIPNGAFNWTEYVHPEDRKHYLDVMGNLLTGDRHSYDLTYRVRIKSGDYASFRVIGSILRNEAGEPSLIGGVMINQGLIENTDPITILRNQYGFFDDLSALLRTGDARTILLIGFRRLSRINEVRGYGYGNRVLQQVGWLIQESVGKRGTVYRMEGSTFAVIAGSVPEQEVAAMYDSIRVKLQRGIRVDGIRNNLVACGGMISTRALQIDAWAVHTCLLYAYEESKTRRNGDLVNYHGSESYGGRDSMDLINEVRTAVLNNCEGFYLRYQPVFSAKTEKPTGVESLVRWHSDTFGEVEPMDFIPILEQDYVFEELGSWILEKAMEDGLKFLRKDPDFLVGINIAPSQLADEYFLDTILQIAEKLGFPVRNLSMELTRSCRMMDIDRIKPVVDSLRKNGIRVVIDDFGSGYESLGILKDLVVDEVKFDRGLVENIDGIPRDQQAVRYLADMASVYGTSVCVKGVNSLQVREILRDYSIGEMQGNYYSRPVSAEEVLKKL